MKNKIISVLLALVMIVSMMPVVAFAAEGGLIYSQTDENLGGKTKWPATTQYVKTLTLEGATIDSCTYNDAKDTCEVVLTEGTSAGAELKIKVARQGMTNTWFNGAEKAATSFTFNLVGGEATVTVKAKGTSGSAITKTFVFSVKGGISVNTPPEFQAGVTSPIDVYKMQGETYSLDVASLFKDVDGNELTYSVKVNDTEPVAVEAVFNYTTDSVGTQTLLFTANDGKDNSEPYTVNLIVCKLDGTGTQNNPYLIKDTQDLVELSGLVANGNDFSGKFLRMENDITLPADWTPIGVLIDPSIGHNDRGANMNAFAGTFDGNNKLLTVPENGLPLFGYVDSGTVIKNLNIYGSKIAGYGLINNLEGVDLEGDVTISKVTLKSGSSTLKSGLVGTYLTALNGRSGCSRDFRVVIKDCTVESGVVVGYNKDQSEIGGLVGRFNGVIENCTSNATVYGVNNVGGLVGCTDQGFSIMSIENNAFGGSVIASGSYAGGIMGSGYGTDTSAPNGTFPNINNNSVTGNVTGVDCVGGICGGDPNIIQSWSNSAYTIKDNSFTGKVEASGDHVGGIIGYLKSINKYADISGNYYKKDCGADKGIGTIKVVDTSAEGKGDATYINTAGASRQDLKALDLAIMGNNTFEYIARPDHNRTDDPVGADAANLCYSDDDIKDEENGDNGGNSEQPGGNPENGDNGGNSEQPGGNPENGDDGENSKQPGGNSENPNKKPETPATGDANNLLPWMMAMAIAAAGVAVLRRKEN